MRDLVVVGEPLSRPCVVALHGLAVPTPEISRVKNFGEIDTYKQSIGEIDNLCCDEIKVTVTKNGNL